MRMTKALKKRWKFCKNEVRFLVRFSYPDDALPPILVENNHHKQSSNGQRKDRQAAYSHESDEGEGSCTGVFATDT